MKSGRRSRVENLNLCSHKNDVPNVYGDREVPRKEGREDRLDVKHKRASREYVLIECEQGTINTLTSREGFSHDVCIPPSNSRYYASIGCPFLIAGPPAIGSTAIVIYPCVRVCVCAVPSPPTAREREREREIKDASGGDGGKRGLSPLSPPPLQAADAARLCTEKHINIT